MKRIFLASSCYQVLAQIVKMIGRDPKKLPLVFVPTAADGEDGDKWWLDRDKEAFADFGFPMTEMNISNFANAELKNKLQQVKIVFVSGGNTYYLLQEMQKTGFDQLIKDFVTKGGIYIGSSAGSIIAAPDIEYIGDFDCIEKAPDLQNFQGLHITDYSVLPHWGGIESKAKYLKNLDDIYHTENKVVLLKDTQFLYQENEKTMIFG